MEYLPALYDIAMSPGGGLFLYASFMTFLWYDTRRKLWRMVQDLETKVDHLRSEYDALLKEKVYYKTLYKYTQQVRDSHK